MSSITWSATVAGALAGFLIGVGTGVSLDWNSRPVPAAIRTAEAPDPGVERLAIALERLTERTEGLAAASPWVRSEARDSAPTRQPAATNDRVDLRGAADLADAIRELTATMRSSPGNARATPSRFARPSVLPNAPVLPAFDSEDQESEFERDLLLLAYQDIVDRFGLPDEISENQSGNGTSWTYGDRRGGESEVCIHFVDGFVANVHARAASD